MLRSTVLIALVRLGEGSDPRGAWAGVEPILRLFARKRVARAQIEAQLTTRLPDAQHVARLAAVTVSGGAVFDPDDLTAVRTEFEGIPRVTPRGAPVLTIGFLALLILGPVASVALYFQLRAFDPRRTHLGSALGPNLTTYELTLSRGGSVAAPRAALLTAARPALDEEGARSLAAVLDRTEAIASGHGDELELDEATRPLNAALYRRALPFVIDARVWQKKLPILYTFYIEREDSGQSGGFRDERVLYLWRLDDVNIAKPVLGYTHRYADAALVLLDQIEAELVSRVLPALADGATAHLIDEKSRNKDEPWQAEAEVDAARATRESFAHFADAQELAHLGTLLGRRAAIVEQWKGDLRQLGLELRPPSRLVPEADYTKDLWIRVSLESRSEWTTIHDDLMSRATLATFERLRDRFAETTGRHELQHRLDVQRSPSCKPRAPCAELRIPERVRKSFGPEPGESATLGSMAARVSEEVSAYLAEMSEGALSPKMTVIGLSRFLYDREQWGDEYSNTAVILFEAIAAELGIVDEAQPLVAYGSVRRKRLTTWLRTMYGASDDDLRAAARRSYTALFGVDLPKATLGVSKRNPSWRH
jgi:hypothetical protein